MTEGEDFTYSKARCRVQRLLSIRERSEEEIRTRLDNQHYTQAVIDDTIKHFKGLGFLDERAFTRSWIVSRLNKPFGLERIHYELIEKGIDRTIIQEELDKALPSYDEDAIVLNLIRQQIKKYTHLKPDKRNQRLIAFLNRRGFSDEAINQALRKFS